MSRYQPYKDAHDSPINGALKSLRQAAHQAKESLAALAEAGLDFPFAGGFNFVLEELSAETDRTIRGRGFEESGAGRLETGKTSNFVH